MRSYIYIITYISTYVYLCSSKTEVVDEKAVDKYKAEVGCNSSCDESTYDTGDFSNWVVVQQYYSCV